MPRPPPMQGRYGPANERDSCGMGFVAHIKGERSNGIIRQGLQILASLDHRGGVGADPSLGDGAGCLIQLTADAVAGEFGEVCEARAIEFLEKGWVTVLASDAHDVDTRPPRMAPGLEVASAILGSKAAQRLVDETPRRIVYGS